MCATGHLCDFCIILKWSFIDYSYSKHKPLKEKLQLKKHFVLKKMPLFIPKIFFQMPYADARPYFLDQFISNSSPNHARIYTFMFIEEL